MLNDFLDKGWKLDMGITSRRILPIDFAAWEQSEDEGAAHLVACIQDRKEMWITPRTS